MTQVLDRPCLLISVLYNRKVKKGSLLIDSSTIDPAVSKEMAVATEKLGAVFMDAPVSGGEMTKLQLPTHHDMNARRRCDNLHSMLSP